MKKRSKLRGITPKEIKTYGNRFPKNENRGLVVPRQARANAPGVLHQVIVIRDIE